MSIRFKPEVRAVAWTPQLALILARASDWSLRSGVDVEVNSIDDGTHGVTTLHGLSIAIDLDTVGDLRKDLVLLHQFLAAVMPQEYDVVWEDDHVHVEMDVRRGRRQIT